MVRGNADRPIYKHSFWEETFHTVAYSGILFGWGGGGVTPGPFLRVGVKQIQLRTEGREDRELAVLAP
jgi:hypothetical protein